MAAEATTTTIVAKLVRGDDRPSPFGLTLGAAGGFTVFLPTSGCAVCSFDHRRTSPTPQSVLGGLFFYFLGLLADERIFVASVAPGSAAARALQPGDEVIAINDFTVDLMPLDVRGRGAWFFGYLTFLPCCPWTTNPPTHLAYK